MEALEGLRLGFGLVFTPAALMVCLIGCIVGTLIGILPGIGTATTIALLLPLIYGRDATLALVMFSGIYLGAQYGGSTTAILMNIPGESSSVITALDGYQLARQGRAGTALAIAAISSFAAGLLGLLGLAFFAPLVARFALAFGPPEQFILISFALLMFCALTAARLSLAMVVLGLLIGTVGSDPLQGEPRFTFGVPQLADGIDFVIVAMGVLGIGEVLTSLDEKTHPMLPLKFRQLLPSLKDVIACMGAMLRSGAIGFILGALPGTGTTAASFLAYIVEKRVSKNGPKFGTGQVEGVAAPEGANNAAVAGAMVPMLTLGIPGSASTALMLAAMIIGGVRPGPLLFTEHPDLVWTVIASLFVANVVLLILNLPLVPLFASLTRIRYLYLYPVIVILAIVGAYSVNNDVFDVWLMLFFGVIGYLLKRLDVPLAPLVLGVVLGPIAETSLVQALSLSRGNPLVFVERPLSLGLLTGSLVLFATLTLIAARNKRRKLIFDDGVT